MVTIAYLTGANTYTGATTPHNHLFSAPHKVATITAVRWGRVMNGRVLDGLSARWQSLHVLKRDVFSTVERGRYLSSDGEVDAVARSLDNVPWWSGPVARRLLASERRALKCAEGLGITSELLFESKSLLVRRWIDGVPLQIAQPNGDINYFRQAKALLRKMHRRGICHNDLAKSQNWLRGRDGRPYVIDFQLAMVFSRRNRLFRVAAYEDLRHLLKHKRRYAEHELTASERRVLAKKSWINRVWMSTGKKVYIWITRGVFHFMDREGGGSRLIEEAPSISKRLMTYPGVREVAIVSFPDRKTGIGLYAFIEADQELSEHALIDFVSKEFDKGTAPEKVQIVSTLPRRLTGEINMEALQLIAHNQLDLLDLVLTTDGERDTVASIIKSRRNLGDRIAGFNGGIDRTALSGS